MLDTNNIGILKMGNIKFIGEIVVQPDDLEKRCRKLGSILANRNNIGNRLREELTILAVNCAYYYYDQSFREHFCKKLDVPIRKWEACLGPEIETYLLENGFLPRPRSNSFRYVGPILEQCGVTATCLNSYVQELKLLASIAGGWEGIKSLSFNLFCNSIQMIGPKYLIKFLKDEGGWKFTHSIATNMAQYQRGLIERDQLCSLPGYRDGFWEQLLKYLYLPPRDKSNNKPIPIPRLIFNPDTLIIEIRLDPERVRACAYKLNDKLILEKTIKLRKESDLLPQYAFKIHHSNGDWISRTISGWCPENKEFAFFSITTGYIDDINKLCIGEYYLIAKGTIQVPPEIIRADLGFLYVPENALAYHVEINSNTDLSLFGCVKKNLPTSFLRWDDNVKKLEFAADFYDVFSVKAPNVIIEHIDLIQNKDVMLVAYIDGNLQRVPCSELRNSAKFDINKYISTVPCKGSIWIEPLSRSGIYAGNDIIERLDFAVINACKIAWTRHLIGYDDDAEITIDSPNGYTIYIENALPIDSRETKWKIPSPLRVIEGVLNTGEFAFRICCKLHRATIERKSKTSGELDSILFYEYLEKGVEYIAEGIANAPIEISLVEDHKSQSIYSMGQFNKIGIKELNTFSFKDAIQQIKPVAARFELNRCLTGLYYLDAFLLEKALYEFANQDKPKIDLLDVHPEIRPSIELLYKILENSLVEELNEINLPNQLGFAFDLIASANIFDGIKIAEHTILKTKITKTTIELLDWYNAAMQISEDDFERAKELATQGERLTPPKLLRWQNHLKGIKSRLDAIVDIRNWLVGWANDVRRHQYTSEIAQLDGGTSLIEGWWLYNHLDQCKNAYLNAIDIHEQKTGIIKDLAAILAIVTLRRLNRHDFEDFLNTKGHATLTKLKMALSGQERWPEGLGKEHIPLSDKDWDYFQQLYKE